MGQPAIIADLESLRIEPGASEMRVRTVALWIQGWWGMYEARSRFFCLCFFFHFACFSVSISIGAHGLVHL